MGSILGGFFYFYLFVWGLLVWLNGMGLFGEEWKRREWGEGSGRKRGREIVKIVKVFFAKKSFSGVIILSFVIFYFFMIFNDSLFFSFFETQLPTKGASLFPESNQITIISKESKKGKRRIWKEFFSLQKFLIQEKKSRAETISTIRVSLSSGSPTKEATGK